jgi:hypothetical protein
MRRSCHDAVVTAQLHNSTNTNTNHPNHPRDQWAHDWAVRMRQALHGVDIDLNLYRKSVLNLLYELCDAWQDETNVSVTSERIVAKFQGHRVENILLLALPLDRAQCLYAMKYPSTNEYGMHWVSSEHFTSGTTAVAAATIASSSSSFDWENEIRLRDGRSTMNKRLVWLLNLSGLAFGSPDIARWLTPTRCEWSLVN